MACTLHSSSLPPTSVSIKTQNLETIQQKFEKIDSFCLFVFSYHDREWRSVHDDGEHSGCDTTEEFSTVTMEGKERDESHRGEYGQDGSEDAKDLSFLLLWRVEKEDQHVDCFYQGSCSVDCAHKRVVL